MVRRQVLERATERERENETGRESATVRVFFGSLPTLVSFLTVAVVAKSRTSRAELFGSNCMMPVQFVMSADAVLTSSAGQPAPRNSADDNAQESAHPPPFTTFFEFVIGWKIFL